jgi:hypothetical protein
MKKPNKIVKWFHVEKELYDPFLDHNGKPLFKYFISLPYWIFKAYHPTRVKVEISEDQLSYNDQIEQEVKREELDKYFKTNWLKKMTKMRKVNNNYMFVSLLGKSKTGFKSMEDYENYHKELQILNEKYCPISSSALQKKEAQP